VVESAGCEEGAAAGAASEREEQEVAVGVDVGQLAHLVVGVAGWAAPAPTGGEKLGGDLVGVFDAQVDPRGGAGGVVVMFEREVQLDSVA
jgi:hypothetical protein